MGFMIPDKTDADIIKVLTEDARLSYRKIAKRLGVSTLTVISRVKKMEQNGVISGYSALINHKNLGLHLTAIMEIKTQKGRIIQAEKLLAGLKNVYGVYDVTGQTDTIVIAKFADTDMLSKFVKKLSANPNIDNIHTHVVLNTIKEDFR